MANNETLNFKRRVSALIDNRRLHDAITEIKEMAHRRMAWDVEDRIKMAEQNYAYMLRYLSQGVVDPERDDVYLNIVNEVYAQLDALVTFIDSIDSSTLYYSNMRYRRMHPQPDALAQMIDAYRKTADKLSIFSLVLDQGQSDPKKDRHELERIQGDIFIRIWTTPHLRNDEAEVIFSLLDAPETAPELAQFVISAVTEGLLQQYDTAKMEILMKTYLNASDMYVSSAALVGMLLGLWKYSNRPLAPRLAKILAAIKDRKEWRTDLRTAFIELIRTRDTERINRKMRDEVIPRMQKLRPDMIDKFNQMNIDPEDPMSLQENPEWQDLLDKSGVADQLKEITEIQMEGGDVMMSTFIHLKGFPFFQTMPNWFLAYDPNHSAVADTVKSLDVVSDIMENARFMCDNDKYSFMMALNTVPEQQRQMMISQLRSQSDSILEMINSRTQGSPDVERRAAVNRYLQNIYRFYKLFYRKDEMFDPFDHSINLIAVPSLAEDFDDPEMLQVVAEFYFKLNYMREALNVYLHLDKISSGDASRYQKMGYCYEKLNDLPEAARYYERALLAGPDATWTVRRIASVYRAMGDKAQALKYYRQLASMLPDDMRVAILYGEALLDNDDIKEAMHEFYRVEFLDESSHRAWRPLAWTLFLAGDYVESRQYYDKIIAEGATADDYLNRGHVDLALHDMGAAVADYSAALKAKDGDREWLRSSVHADLQHLDAAAVDPSLIPLVIDAAVYG